MSYRFRTGDKGELVLQIAFRPDGYDPATGSQRPVDFRDATIADIPVGDPFKDAVSNGVPISSGKFWISTR